MDPAHRGQLPAFISAPPAPVLCDDQGTEPVWMVADYDAAERLITDPDLYPTHRHEYGLDLDHLRQGPVNGAGLIAAEPSRHAALRRLVGRRFTPGSVRALRPHVETVVHELIDAVVATSTNRFDMVAAVSRPLATRVMAGILGLDGPFDELMATVWTWMDAEYHVVASVARLTDQRSHWQWWEALLERRKAQLAAGEAAPPGILADLLAAQAAGYLVDGRPLTDVDIIGTAEILLAAGAATSAAALPTTVLLADDAGVLAELGDPVRARAAALEGLRMDSPFPFLARRTRGPDVVAGCPVPAGALMLCNITAAQRDPARWFDPHAFRLDRADGPAGMLAFGRGAHRCLGEGLAYLELEVGLHALVQRLAGLKVVDVAERRFGLVSHLPSVTCAYDPTG